MLFVEIGRKQDRTVDVAVAAAKDVAVAVAAVKVWLFMLESKAENVIIQLVLLDGMQETIDVAENAGLPTGSTRGSRVDMDVSVV